MVVALYTYMATPVCLHLPYAADAEEDQQTLLPLYFTYSACLYSYVFLLYILCVFVIGRLTHTPWYGGRQTLRLENLLGFLLLTEGEMHMVLCVHI